ncbi:alpha-galactosidase [Lacticaseibacillus rhamnosus]|nr:Hypothetical protein LOCK900_2843 [Lacticaseibacillus rhamnosus LOCK900]MCT3143839.1 alpha-galactosidase [Lacticaseibacillus rhamnosus]MCT3153182.1 alpha-galactosidase [Lacticaseibacillus rhamnosus]MCT3160910.1 alpha-galactosidase [Lacticaseibacillus rhamnosus]MCT3164070.1 alpha-galactosidase [Lacticaseibacillus rhamnosus]
MARTRAITLQAAYTPIPKRAGSRSITRSPAQNLRVRTLVAMAKTGPSRPRPLTLRSLSAPVHAHHIKKSSCHW